MAKIRIASKKIDKMTLLREIVPLILRLLALGYFMAATWVFKENPINATCYIGLGNFFLLSWFISKFS